MNRRAVFCVMVAALVLSLSACGKKGPPIPPSSPVPPEISDLKITIEENLMTLSWRVVAKEGKADPVPAGFFVYRSRLDLAGGCLDCPLQFEKAADIPVENTPVRTTYKELLEKGFRYGYKVSSYIDRGNKGPASAVVSVDFPGPQEN